MDKFREKLKKETTPSHLKAIALLQYLYGDKIRIKTDDPVIIKGKNGERDKHYYLDIAIASAKLALEIDGGIHNDRVDKDWKRDEAIMRLKKTLIVRFPNEEVLKNPKSFLFKVNQSLITRIQFISQSDMFNSYVNKFLNTWGIPEMRFMDGVRQFVVEAKALQSKIDSFTESALGGRDSKIIKTTIKLAPPRNAKKGMSKKPNNSVEEAVSIVGRRDYNNFNNPVYSRQGR